MIHRLAAFLSALAVTALLTATAVAGGWATATLDPGTTGPQAGTPTTLGFRVLQHGMTPNSSLSVVVHGSRAGGGSVSAAASPEGEVGHYIASMTFPADGAWTISWSSELDMAGSVATLNVTPAVAAPAVAPPAGAPVVSPTPATSGVPVDPLALIIVALVLALAVLGGAVALRRRRTGTSVPSVG